MSLTPDDVPEKLIVRIGDITRVGHCPSGVRRWFTAHELDFRAFMRDGISARTLVETGDALALRVVALKLDRESAHG